MKHARLPAAELPPLAFLLASKVGGYYAVIHNCAQGEGVIARLQGGLARSGKMATLPPQPIYNVTNEELASRPRRREFRAHRIKSRMPEFYGILRNQPRCFDHS